MSAISINQLGETFLTQLNEILTGGDETARSNSGAFVTWCQPGLPFEASDFDFCVKGLFGGTNAEENRSLLQQAFNCAQLLDFIPNRSGVYKDDAQQAIFESSQARLSHMYGEILKLSKVVSSELTDKEKEKLEKFRNLLFDKQKKVNLGTDEETEVTVDGPMLQAYNEQLAAYTLAALEYNSKRLAAIAATGAGGNAAVADWAMNASLYRAKVKAAEDAWTAKGFRNEIDQINAFINQVGLRDMTLWKQGLLEAYNDAFVSGLGPGQEFFYTTLLPGNFASSDGWTKYSIKHTETESLATTKRKNWKAGGGIKWGIFGAGGNASSDSSSQAGEFSVSDFELSFELTQCIVSRSGFYPEFFMNRGWTLQKGHGWHFDEMPSDGMDPPKGNFVGYPTKVLFVRNVVIRSKELSTMYENKKKEFSAKGGLGWGPLRLSGSYGSASTSRKFESDVKDDALTVPGMQMVGLCNQMVGRAPNPADGLTDEDFT